jgi:hypothetical protein
MRKLPCLLAAAAISGLAFVTPISASPLASGLAPSNTAVPSVDDGLIQKVHGFHCRRKFSNRRGWHRHRRACYDYGFYEPYPYHYGLGVPFFGLSIIDDDFRFRRHHRFRRHKDWWD